MTDSPSLLRVSGVDILRARFNQYKIFDRLDNPEVASTPDLTPTTVSPRLARSRPQMYRAKNIANGKIVGIKVVDQNCLQLLENEWTALDKLKKWGHISLITKIAPILYSGMEYDSARKVYFIVYEWIEGWISIAELVKMNPLISDPNAANIMCQLRNALFWTTKFLHFIGIVHGDSKDEHIFLRRVKRNDGTSQIFFDKIRIIDFGGCYLLNLEDWKGGSLGFSSPYFWASKNRHLLSRQELQAIDWYGMYAVLYYAYTGECFPAASPAYSSLSEPSINPQARLYYLELKRALKMKCQSHSTEVQTLINEAIEYLCSPDSLTAPPMYKFFPIKKIHRFSGE